MNNKWLKIILVASLALNIAFISTALYRKWTPASSVQPQMNTGNSETPEAPPQLNLTPDQRKDIWAIMKNFRLDMLQYKQEILDRRMAIVEALGDADFSPEDVEKKTAELNQLENKLNFVFVDALIQVNNILDSQQRLNFLLRMSKDWFFVPEHHRRHARGAGYSNRKSGGKNE